MLAEVLGEAMQLADRLDGLKVEIPAAAKAAAGQIAAASADAIAKQKTAHAEMLRDMQGERALWGKATKAASGEVGAAALVVNGATNKLIWLIVVLCGLVSALAGGGGAWVAWRILEG